MLPCLYHKLLMTYGKTDFVFMQSKKDLDGRGPGTTLESAMFALFLWIFGWSNNLRSRA